MRNRASRCAWLIPLLSVAATSQAQVTSRLIEEVSVAELDGYATVTILFGCDVRYVSHFPASGGDTLRIRLSPGPCCGSPAAGWVVPPVLDGSAASGAVARLARQEGFRRIVGRDLEAGGAQQAGDRLQVGGVVVDHVHHGTRGGHQAISGAKEKISAMTAGTVTRGTP